jgi:hydroxymethylpyrimidine/phosphomethylpyrimidine kinase
MGIQADLATFAALGCHGLSVTTGLLIGDSARVEDMQEIDADWVVDQARVLLEDMPVAAFKVGALANRAGRGDRRNRLRLCPDAR